MHMICFFVVGAFIVNFLGCGLQIHQESKVPIFFWGVAMFGLAIFAAVVVAYKRHGQSKDGYQFIAT